MSGFTGGGVFLRIFNWAVDKGNGVKISFNRNDSEDNGIADGLSNLMLKDGQQTATALIPFASGLRTSDGTVAAPGISFLNDTDTGLYRIGTNNIAFAAGGAKVLDLATATASTAMALNLTVPLAVSYGGNGGTNSFVRLWGVADQDLTTVAVGQTFGVSFFANDGTNIINDADGLNYSEVAPSFLPGAIKIKQAGTYFITTTLKWVTDFGPGTIVARIWKQSANTFLAEASHDYSSVETYIMNLSAIAELAVDDIIEIQYERDGTQDATVIKSISGLSPILCAIRIGN